MAASSPAAASGGLWTTMTDDEIFDSFDLAGNGSLSVDEVEAALREARLPTRHGDVMALFARMDANGDGKVSRREFKTFTAARRARLRLAFDRICAIGTGGAPEAASSAGREGVVGGSRSRRVFTARHLREAAADSDITLSDDDVRIIIRNLARDDDSKTVSFPDFVEALMLAPRINPRAFFDTWFIDSFSDDSMSEYTVPREMRAAPSEATDRPSFAAMVGKKIACGGIAGVISRTATAPIDRVRLMMMASETPLSIASAFHSAIDHPRRYLALWTGNGVNCVKIAPEMGIKLVAFDVIRKAIASDPDNVTTAERFAAGGAAGAIGQTVVYPLEVVRTRLSTAPRGTYAGALDCVRAVWAGGGAAAFAAGLAPSIFGIIPYAAIDLALNSLLKDKASAYLSARGEEVSVPMLLGCGMASSTVATLATFPLGVVRTKAQATGGGVLDVVRSMQGQGLRGWYRGVVPCLTKVLPSTSISYTVYEKLVAEWGRGRGGRCPVSRS